MLAKPKPRYKRYSCVTPSFDNASRRQSDAVILQNATPEIYEHWLKEVVQRSLSESSEENLIFINAWNECAEGNHLEPCQRWVMLI